MRVEHRATLPAPRERVLSLLQSGPWLRDRHGGAHVIEVDVVEVSRTEARLEQAVHVVEAARGLSGWESAGWRVRRQEATRRSWISYLWHRPEARCEWRHHGPEDKFVSLNGTVALTDQGQQTEVLWTTTIEVELPLVGGLAARSIAAGVRQGLALQEQQLTEALQ